ncbi:carbohydrate ABC transporter substrate-binding protein, CUT1 family [Thalassospira xiamenensis M-5 = DSM 17429]|uniref:Probable sugar-binding periplasmic protein n=1 Tax=Thalassospira xiamenensis M-5 = DSM 17429 TaxID=1123366 RepID=A0AB72UD11_9PROT|nr:extracellular solute-binding protein [Thalassospira xiamenensis]AJD52043.1 extracellular solute-binding protein [Thalassospira xiamenensis M-5 = DSM 17429]SIS92618.1 carbohydrate ABC transporter substrate-binding protein, CUT1 family [Thalassospira xiamenensis M-5 = DSM 17429]
MSNKVFAKGLAAALAASVALVPLMASAGELVIESWRNDDIDIWNDQIIPAFNKEYPEIKVTFSPTPPTDYNALINAKFAGGTAGDLITCRPFDASLELYKQGNLAPLDDIKGMDNFSDVAKSAWQTDDGSATFCLPMASVIHGFIYNKEAFEAAGVEVPKTREEFYAALDKIKEEGSYIPMAMGTADQWEAATMGFQNIGPNYWKGEEGRKALIDGNQKFTDKPYIDTFTELASWSNYLPDGYEAISYPDAQNLFSLGRAAVYPAGSWDISLFNSQAEFEFGAFPPPPAAGSDTCYISDHTDIALGLNAKSPNAAEAKIFLEWMTGSEFASLYSNALPGFFSLSNHKVEISDPVANEFVSWRQKCESTIRNSYQILSRGTPNLENELWNISAQVINGTVTPEEAGQATEAGLAKWYAPHQ